MLLCTALGAIPYLAPYFAPPLLGGYLAPYFAPLLLGDYLALYLAAAVPGTVPGTLPGTRQVTLYLAATLRLLGLVV